MTIDFSPACCPANCNLEGLEERVYDVTMRIRAWHSPSDEPITPENIKDFLTFFLERGYQDLWCVAVIENIESIKDVPETRCEGTL